MCCPQAQSFFTRARLHTNPAYRGGSPIQPAFCKQRDGAGWPALAELRRSPTCCPHSVECSSQVKQMCWPNPGTSKSHSWRGEIRVHQNFTPFQSLPRETPLHGWSLFGLHSRNSSNSVPSRVRQKQYSPVKGPRTKHFCGLGLNMAQLGNHKRERQNIRQPRS